jgi:hypothetical protein
MFSLIFFSSFTADGQLPDKKMADKYGLTISPPNELIDPAPEWLLNSDMFVDPAWYIAANKPGTQNTVWKGYDFELKDVLVERKIRVASANCLKKIHEQVPVVIDGTFDGSSIKGVSLISHAPIRDFELYLMSISLTYILSMLTRMYFYSSILKSF